MWSVRFKEEFEMSDLPQISEAEFEVMKIVWKHAPISTNEITDKLLQTLFMWLSISEKGGN